MTIHFAKPEGTTQLPEEVSSPDSPGGLLLERLGRIPFREAHLRMLDLQKQLACTDQQLLERLILFEPGATITLGSASQENALLLPRQELEQRGVSVLEVDRGGEITFHGPGQVVGYLILKLQEDERDLHRIPRLLEESLMGVLDQLGIDGHRQEGRTGVWVKERKIASIGISVRRWVSGHGFSLLVDGDLTPFDWIVPCGIHDCQVTSVEKELGIPPDRQWIEEQLAQQIAIRFSRELVE